MEKAVDFSSSINPLGMPEEAVSAAGGAIKYANIYPDTDCLRLCSVLAGYEDVPAADILCGNGASDIIFRLAYARKPGKILVTAPAFSDYERAGKAAGAEVMYYTLKRENGFGIKEDILSIIRNNSPDLVFICNPNNPTGNMTSMDMMVRIAKACSSVRALLVADECFLDFVASAGDFSVKPLLRGYKNIILVKAFTKVFAMPGLRLGYAICADTDLLTQMRRSGPDWAASNIAQEAGIAALKNGKAFVEKTCRFVQGEREFLFSGLGELGMTVYPSQANYIFFHCPWDKSLSEKLYDKDILIRDCSNFRGLSSGHYRVAVSTRDKNEMLIAAIKSTAGNN